MSENRLPVEAAVGGGAGAARLRVKVRAREEV